MMHRSGRSRRLLLRHNRRLPVRSARAYDVARVMLHVRHAPARIRMEACYGEPEHTGKDDAAQPRDRREREPSAILSSKRLKALAKPRIDRSGLRDLDERQHSSRYLGSQAVT